MPQELVHKPAMKIHSSGNCMTSAPKRHEHIIVQHDYHDHSLSEVPQDFNSCELALASSGNGANTAFPLKLYDMLQRVEEEGLSHVVSWQPHGRAFLVHKPDEFAKILPHYFKQKKIASFQRQLNLYGFVRLTRGADRNAYYHERFLRGRPFLISGISRCKVKGTGVRARSNPEQEPNFWKMTWVGKTSAQPFTELCVDVNQGSTSVVSADEDHHIQDEQEDEDFEPLPIESGIMTTKADDIVMSGWGMPFHYLGSVKPCEQACSAQSNLLIEPEPISSFQSFTYPSSSFVIDFLDDAEFEKTLEDLLNESDDCDLALQLEGLIS
jgi:hypothetical protein